MISWIENMGFVIINVYNYFVKLDIEMNGCGWYVLFVEK